MVAHAAAVNGTVQGLGTVDCQCVGASQADCLIALAAANLHTVFEPCHGDCRGCGQCGRQDDVLVLFDYQRLPAARSLQGSLLRLGLWSGGGRSVSMRAGGPPPPEARPASLLRAKPPLGPCQWEETCLRDLLPLHYPPPEPQPPGLQHLLSKHEEVKIKTHRRPGQAIRRCCLGNLGLGGLSPRVGSTQG